jgi:hypothetical protein
MEMKIRARGARVVQQFNLNTDNKSPARIQKDTEALIVTKDLYLY